MNSGPHACTAGTLPIQSCPSPKTLSVLSLRYACLGSEEDRLSVCVVFWMEFPPILRTLGKALTNLSGAMHLLLPFSVGRHHSADQSLLGFNVEAKPLPGAT